MKIMKFFLIVCALITLSKPLFSQRLILRGGLTQSWITFNDSDLKLKNGFGLGVGFELPFNPNIFIQPEIGFVSKGSNFDQPFDDTGFTIYYLELPVPVKYYFGTSKVHVLIAPTLGIGIAGKYEGYGKTFDIEFDGYPSDGYDLANLSYLDNRFDFSLQIGTGIELWDNLIFEFRYTHGFTRLYTDFTRRDFGNENADNAYNRSFQFTIGIPFKLSKKKSD